MSWTKTPPKGPGFKYWRSGASKYYKCIFVCAAGQASCIDSANKHVWLSLETLGGEWWDSDVPEPEKLCQYNKDTCPMFDKDS